MTTANHADMARARIAHACARMTELMLACSQYLDTNLFQIEREFFNLDAVPCVRFRYRVSALPPLTLGLLTGEVVHQLRATLDNLVWALGQNYPSSDKKANNDRLAFPVADSQESFDELLTKREYIGIRDFPAVAQLALVEAQSFKRELNDPDLGVLNRLWNADKHRVPSIYLSHSRGISQELDLRQPAFISMGEIADGVVFCEGALPPQGIADDALPRFTGVALGIRDPLLNANYVFLPLLYGHMQLVSLFINKVSHLLRI